MSLDTPTHPFDAASLVHVCQDSRLLSANILLADSWFGKPHQTFTFLSTGIYKCFSKQVLASDLLIRKRYFSKSHSNYQSNVVTQSKFK